MPTRCITTKRRPTKGHGLEQLRRDELLCRAPDLDSGRAKVPIIDRLAGIPTTTTTTTAAARRVASPPAGKLGRVDSARSRWTAIAGAPVDLGELPGRPEGGAG